MIEGFDGRGREGSVQGVVEGYVLKVNTDDGAAPP
jgi:hypothetical protein